ncbi:hypothetical protein IQ07DRAFT_642070 [Pyrenochaeta sp. DS3sAY3a]|nr:hypothetical protein IQ07DRAFT_642070 [Pyrenochaeta sp. DS3sAY3a]
MNSIHYPNISVPIPVPITPPVALAQLREAYKFFWHTSSLISSGQFSQLSPDLQASIRAKYQNANAMIAYYPPLEVFEAEVAREMSSTNGLREQPPNFSTGIGPCAPQATFSTITPSRPSTAPPTGLCPPAPHVTLPVDDFNQKSRDELLETIEVLRGQVDMVLTKYQRLKQELVSTKEMLRLALDIQTNRQEDDEQHIQKEPDEYGI